MPLKTPVISERLDLYKKFKEGPEPMEALAAYGKPTASPTANLRQEMALSFGS